MESLRQLRHVVALAEHRHFRRAADAIGITQAALTLSIQKLEEDYAVPLFERRKGDVAVTQYGEIVLETAQTTLARISTMKRELALTRKLAKGQLIVGCDAHFAGSLMAAALARLMAGYPHLEFNIESGKWSQMREKLLSKEIDVFLGFELDDADPQIAVENHTVPPFVAFCSTGHPILEIENRTFLHCFDYPIVVPPTTRWIQNRMQPLVSKVGSTVRMPAFLYTTDYAIIRRFVRENGALGFGQLRDVIHEVNSGQFKYFVVEELNTPVTISVVNLERRSLPVATTLLLQALRHEVVAMEQEWAIRPKGS